MSNDKRKNKQKRNQQGLPARGKRRAAGSEGERSEPQRTAVSRFPRAAGEAEGAADAGREGPLEVRPSKPTRRVFTKAYKLAILDEAAACDQPGQVGALLRREGLYASHLTQWRAARERGELDPTVPSRRGPKPNPQARQLAAELAKAKRREARLEEELRKARLIIEAQKKVAQLLDAIDAEDDETH